MLDHLSHYVQRYRRHLKVADIVRDVDGFVCPWWQECEAVAAHVDQTRSRKSIWRMGPIFKGLPLTNYFQQEVQTPKCLTVFKITPQVGYLVFTDRPTENTSDSIDNGTSEVYCSLFLVCESLYSTKEHLKRRSWPRPWGDAMRATLYYRRKGKGWDSSN